MTSNDKSREKLLFFLGKAMDTATSETSILKLNNNDPQHLLTVSLYGSILEILSAFILCAQKELADTLALRDHGRCCDNALEAVTGQIGACKIFCVNGHCRLQTVTTGGFYGHTRQLAQFLDEGLQET